MISNLENYLIENKEKFYRLAYSYAKNEQDALDIVQESIYKAIKNQKTLHDDTIIKTWFYQILVHTAIDFIRKNSKLLLVTEQDLEKNVGTSEDDYTDFDLQNALDALPAQDKMIITLRYFEDLKIEEIANILIEYVNSVKTKLYRILKKLRLTLEP